MSEEEEQASAKQQNNRIRRSAEGKKLKPQLPIRQWHVERGSVEGRPARVSWVLATRERKKKVNEPIDLITFVKVFRNGW
jgi:hypothetical protein